MDVIRKFSNALGRTPAVIPLLGFIVAAISFYICLPHRIKETEAVSTLPGNVKMEVRATFRSPWGWENPSNLTKLEVRFDGKEVAIPDEAYRNLVGFDPQRAPLAASKFGFPVFIVWGLIKSPLHRVEWRFMNSSLSERVVFHDSQMDRVEYPGPEPQVRILPSLLTSKDLSSQSSAELKR